MDGEGFRGGILIPPPIIRVYPAKIFWNIFFRAVKLLAFFPYTYIGMVKDMTNMCETPIIENTLRGP
jgi:hypothetical protein